MSNILVDLYWVGLTDLGVPPILPRWDTHYPDTLSTAQCSAHLKLRAEPEVDDDVLVELAPDVERGEHHGVHEEGDPHEERDHDAAHPVERQHEEVVSRPTVKNSDLAQFISYK